jgi:hypothetical protein
MMSTAQTGKIFMGSSSQAARSLTHGQPIGTPKSNLCGRTLCAYFSAFAEAISFLYVRIKSAREPSERVRIRFKKGHFETPNKRVSN